jgi:hypothetical protein
MREETIMNKFTTKSGFMVEYCGLHPDCCPTHAAAGEMKEALKGMLAAAEELLAEFASKKRAADWGVVNDAMMAASRAIKIATPGKTGRPRKVRP